MEQDLSQRILQAVDDRHDRVVSFLRELVRIPSQTGQEGTIQAFIADVLRSMDLRVDVFEPDMGQLRDHPAFVNPEMPLDGRPNVVGCLRGVGGGKSLLLNGHVDTITVEPTDQWTDGPYSGAVRDGAIWGRGTSDMKGGLAAMTMALGVLLDLGLRPGGDLILEYVVDEEWSGLGTLACVVKGYRADAGICCETSDLEVMPACIGRLWFTIEVRGKPSGIAARWESVSAIEKGVKLVQAVDELEKMRIENFHHPLYPDNRGALPCAVTVFDSGTFPSATPEFAILRGSMGLMPYEEIQDAMQSLQAQIERTAMSDAWLRNHPPTVSFKDGMVAPGAEIPPNHPIVESLRRCYQSVTGAAAAVSGRKGAADTRFLIRYGSTPTAIFGPGITSQMHAMNEHLPVENLIAATKVLALAIHDWCG